MKELDEVICSARLIQLKTVLDEMICQNRLSETERDSILNKAGLKKEGNIWIDEMGSEYTNI